MTEKQQNRDSLPPPPLGRDKVGRYDVIYPIAQGGMASVYAGRLSGMAGFEKLVAIKIIHPHLASNPRFVDMFLDEARLAAQIHHPNVAEISEVGEDDNLLFMIGELIKGQSLRSFFRRSRALGAEISHTVAADIVSKTCLGLHAAHELLGPEGQLLNLVHRDVSPRNILISYDGFVKLIDFGVAWAQTRSSHTADGVVKGKIGFMSPEQIQGERLDRRSDIFSLGVVLYLSVTGAQPFSGRSDIERINSLLLGTFPRPRDVNPKISPELEAIIMKALATDRNKRFRTMSQMSQAIDEFTRNSDEEVGTETLNRLMLWLFSEEHRTQEEKVRRWRKESLSGALAYQGDTGSVPSSASSGEHKAPESEPLRLLDGLLSEVLGPNRLKYIIGLSMLALFGTIAFILLYSGGNDKTPAGDNQSSPVSSIEENLVVHGIPPALTEDGDRTHSLIQEELLDNSSIGSSASNGEGTQFYTVTLELTPLSTSVTLDSKNLGFEVRELQVPADGKRHRITFSAPGYRSVTRTIVSDREQTLTVDLKEKKAQRQNARTPRNKKKERPGIGLKSSPYD